MTLAEISKGYRETEKALSLRISELRALLKRERDYRKRDALQERVNKLVAIRTDVRATAALCEHYYERSFDRGKISNYNRPRYTAKAIAETETEIDGLSYWEIAK